MSESRRAPRLRRKVPVIEGEVRRDARRSLRARLARPVYLLQASRSAVVGPVRWASWGHLFGAVALSGGPLVPGNRIIGNKKTARVRRHVAADVQSDLDAIEEAWYDGHLRRGPMCAAFSESKQATRSENTGQGRKGE